MISWIKQVFIYLLVEFNVSAAFTFTDPYRKAATC